MKLPSVKKMLALNCYPNPKCKKRRLQAAKAIFQVMIKKIILIDLDKQETQVHKIDIQQLASQIIQKAESLEQYEQFLFAILNVYCKKEQLYFQVEKQITQFTKHQIKIQRQLSKNSFQSKANANCFIGKEKNYKIKTEQKSKSEYSQPFQNSSTSLGEMGLNAKLEMTNYGSKKQQIKSLKNEIKQLFTTDFSSIIKNEQTNDSFVLNSFQCSKYQMQVQVQAYMGRIQNYNSQLNQFIQQMSFKDAEKKIIQQGGYFKFYKSLKIQNSYTKLVQETFQGIGKGKNKKAAQLSASKELLQKIFFKYPLLLEQYTKKIQKKNLKTL